MPVLMYVDQRMVWSEKKRFSIRALPMDVGYKENKLYTVCEIQRAVFSEKEWRTVGIIKGYTKESVKEVQCVDFDSDKDCLR